MSFHVQKQYLFLSCLFLALAALAEPVPQDSTGCISAVTGESVVLAGESKATLLLPYIQEESFTVRSAYLADKEGVTLYEEGKDYILDPKAGTIQRTAHSSIPDFSKNMLYGKKDFNHVDYPGFGNSDFFVYIDYLSDSRLQLFSPTVQTETLKKTKEKLLTGEALKIIAYGDSITAGGDASELKLQFPERYADWLQEQFPAADITLENGATGGDSTVQGIQRLEEKVLTRSPDLVLVGFGMNDHNKGWMEPEVFGERLTHIVKSIKENTGAEVILFSAFPPNPDWTHSSNQMDAFAAVTEQVAQAEECAYADVYAVWMTALRRKDLPSLLANNINHPSDFGHWLYFEALKSISF